MDVRHSTGSDIGRWEGGSGIGELGLKPNVWIALQIRLDVTRGILRYQEDNCR